MDYIVHGLIFSFILPFFFSSFAYFSFLFLSFSLPLYFPLSSTLPLSSLLSLSYQPFVPSPDDSVQFNTLSLSPPSNSVVSSINVTHDNDIANVVQVDIDTIFITDARILLSIHTHTHTHTHTNACTCHLHTHTLTQAYTCKYIMGPHTPTHIHVPGHAIIAEHTHTGTVTLFNL